MLPPGIHRLTIEELRASPLVRGDGTGPWDAAWRGYLVDNFERLYAMLCAIGIDRVFIGGSFVERKAQPSDIDGYFYVDDPDAVYDGRLEARLNELDPARAWGWEAEESIPDPEHGRQLRMREVYAVELYPCVRSAFGVIDPLGRPLGFEEGFAVQRVTFERKGIVLIAPA
jgi:hypothetical protein